jgi:opacity protein-like surface antigen
MKRILLAAALTIACASAASAGSARSNTGCGLGSLLWENKADGSVASQSLQATTNGTFGNQTFGITTGTLGCSQPGKVVKSEQLNRFVKSNIDNLATDIARGHGENLDAFAELLQIPVEKRAEFAAKLQSNFAKVFTSDQVVLAEVIDNSLTVTN